jgi:hypothetical protein
VQRDPHYGIPGLALLPDRLQRFVGQRVPATGSAEREIILKTLAADPGVEWSDREKTQPMFIPERVLNGAGVDSAVNSRLIAAEFLFPRQATAWWVPPLKRSNLYCLAVEAGGPLSEVQWTPGKIQVSNF